MRTKNFRNVIMTFFLLYIMICINGCAFSNNDSSKVSRDIMAMDTYMMLTAYGTGANEAIEEGITEIKRLDNLLSTGKSESEVFLINNSHGGNLSEDTLYLWNRSYEIFEKTDGAFDVTIYPVMKKWGFADQNYKKPNDDELKRLLENVDSRLVNVDEGGKSISLPENVEIDFGGIGKGYTSERVAAIMKSYMSLNPSDKKQEKSITGAMLNLGGNVQLVGTKPDGSLFKVGIRQPFGNGEYLGVLNLSNVAIITSGGYERYFEEDGTTYHHIIDPKTGYPANNGLVSVTIICKDGTLADGYSTALYVMGKEKAIDYWKSHCDEFEMVLLTSDDELIVSEGLRNSFTSEHRFSIVEK